MNALEVRGIVAGYGTHGVLDGVDLTVPCGGTTAVLGASGSGKTTLLRVVAGFLVPREGSVRVGGVVVVDAQRCTAPERRGVGYVRQDGGLFPHLDVSGNIAFGLPWPRRRHQDRVDELLDLVGLPREVGRRRPDQLSGGQQQRVALARALAPEPALVLLDEPFASLDTALRAATREATARALRAAGASAILVTHDQGEALSFADEVAVLRDGRFHQVAPPRDVYGAPVDRETAVFLGDAVLVAGDVDGDRVRCVLGSLPVTGPAVLGPVDVMVRPEQVRLVDEGAPGDVPGVRAMVTEVSFYGHDAVVHLRLGLERGQSAEPETVPADRRLRARVIGTSPPQAGEVVRVSVAGPVRVFPRPHGEMDG